VVEDSMTPSPIVVRLSCLPRNAPATWNEARAVLDEIGGALMHATPSLGIIRCVLSGDTELSAIQRLINISANPTVIFERLPNDAWNSLAPSVVADALSRRVKNAFDPFRILNPGIMGPVA